MVWLVCAAGDEKTIIGNYYAERFKSGWDAVHMPRTSERARSATRAFTETMRASTIPAAVKEAASANLSTLATTTCFRTADGEFHGFEGSDDTRGCCHGNCTHVWNYETATPFLFPSFARSLRRSSFGFSMDDAGAMHFRQMLPDGKSTLGIRGGRWTDGTDHPCLDRLEDFRRRCSAAEHLAAREEGD